MRIAFQTFTRPLWMAGMVTFQDLLIALHTLGSDRPTLDLVQWENSPSSDYAMLEPYTDAFISAKYPAPIPDTSNRPRSRIETSRALGARLRRRAARALVPAPPPQPPEETLRQANVDISFSVLIENRRDCSAPLLIWIYDLQHHHFPELIPARERNHRDYVITREIERAARLVVKSSSNVADLETFFPQARGKVALIPWVADIPASAYATQPAAVAKRYTLPERFFYLPNQFWTHKNHALVVEALRQLGTRGVKPVVVCTGSLHDHRDPDAIGKLLSSISVFGLRDRFILLGSIPRDDVFALMRQCLAVMNPSLFEGFGLSAAEAKSLGKRTLLSDLAPLREQQAPETVYFNPTDAQELADKMELLWRTVPPGPDLALESEARAALPHRQRQFAETFLETARQAIASFHRPRAVVKS